MKLKSLLTGAALAASLGASAQTWIADSAIMNTRYVNDVYYSMQNGKVATPANNTWHLAFQMTPPGPYGNVSVLANSSQTGIQVYNIHRVASTSFKTLSSADTAGKLTTQLYNSDTSWNYGAFNRTKDPANIFNYSWGTYNLSTHRVTGDSIYILKMSDTARTAYKLSIQQYIATPADSIQWKFKIAALNDTTETPMTIIRPGDYPNKLFAYYNLTTKAVTDREPVKTSWDILFTRYVSEATQGGITLMVPTTGVMSNFGVTVADVRGVNADTATMTGRTFSSKANEIGSDWKINVPMSGSYYMDTFATYFIKTAGTTPQYWQLHFTDFSSTGGRILFRKRQITPTSINSINNSISNYFVTPVPANDKATLMMDTKEASNNAVLLLTDMSGRTIQRQTLNVAKGMNTVEVNTANVPAGMYLLSVTGSNIRLTQKISVAH